MKKRYICILLATILMTASPVLGSENVNNTGNSLSVSDQMDMSMPDTVSPSKDMPEADTGLSLPDSESSPVTDTKNGMGGSDITTIVGDMTKAAMNDKEMSLSDALTQNFGLALGSSDYFESGSFHEVDLKLDTSILESQYTSMADTLMKENFESLDMLGKSQNAMSLFSSEFGEIAEGLSLDTYEMPKSFNPQNMVDMMHSSMTKEYADAIGTGSFASIKNSIDIGDIFSKANQGLSSDIVANLMDTGSMRSMLNGTTGGFESEMTSEYNFKKAQNEGLGKQDLSSFYSTAMENTMNAFDWSSSMVYGANAMSNMQTNLSNAESIGRIGAAQFEKGNIDRWIMVKNRNADELASIAAANGEDLRVHKAVDAAEDFVESKQDEREASIQEFNNMTKHDQNRAIQDSINGAGGKTFGEN